MDASVLESKQPDAPMSQQESSSDEGSPPTNLNAHPTHDKSKKSNLPRQELKRTVSDTDDSEWQRDPLMEAVPSPMLSPRQERAQNQAVAFAETRLNLKDVRTHELRIKVAPNESNSTILSVAERALVDSEVLEGRLVLREVNRVVVEVGLRPVTIDIIISQDLDRCVLVKAYEPVPEHLFSTLKDAFTQQVQLSTRIQNNLSGLEEEHEEPINGPSVQSLLDPDYVNLLKNEMRQRSEKDLTAFATPLERRARDDEKRVKRLEQLLISKYKTCHLPLPTLEKAAPLSSFPLNITDAPAKLTLRSDPSPREVDAQLKMALRRDLHNESLARQERKKKEVLARAEVCERNRYQLVSFLANSRAALESDRELMGKLGVQPPQVALCRIGCMHARKPGFLIVTHKLVIFEPVGMFGFRLGEIVKLQAETCRSVMKGPSNLGIVDSLCVRTDTQEEYMFYMATIEDGNEQLDMVFELLWQVLRMNRWVNSTHPNSAETNHPVTSQQSLMSQQSSDPH